MNACMSEFRIVNPTLRTFSAAEARIAHSSIRFNNLSAAGVGLSGAYSSADQLGWLHAGHSGL